MDAFGANSNDFRMAVAKFASGILTTCAEAMWGIQQLKTRKMTRNLKYFFTVFPPFRTKLSHSGFERMARMPTAS